MARLRQARQRATNSVAMGMQEMANAARAGDLKEMTKLRLAMRRSLAFEGEATKAVTLAVENYVETKLAEDRRLKRDMPQRRFTRRGA